MDYQHSLPFPRGSSPRPDTFRQRSNSFPIVQALGCSTPEAQLILAEGRAAVRKRRARNRQNRSVNDEDVTTFDPREHFKYLDGSVASEKSKSQPILSHARLPSNVTDRSTSTVVPPSSEVEPRTEASPISPLGDYSANLAQFIKTQLRSIPTYQSDHDATSPLSLQSCPDFSFPMRGPSQSSNKSPRRNIEPPKVIEIPPVRPPMMSTFSAWSSTDDEAGGDESPLTGDELFPMAAMSKASNYTPSILGYYEHNNSSFLLSSTSTPEEEEPDTAKTITFPNHTTLPGSATEHPAEEDYPSSCLSRPQLSTSSLPSCSSASASGSFSSYFDCKRPMSLAPELKDRIIAALTPPIPYTSIVTATSPWEGAAMANVHDVFVESQQRVHVDGMSFDMIRDFVVPNRLSTSC